MGITKNGQICWDCGRNKHECICWDNIQNYRPAYSNNKIKKDVESKKNQTDLVVGDYVSYIDYSDEEVGIVKEITNSIILIENQRGHSSAFREDNFDVIYPAKSTSFSGEYKVGAIVKYIKKTFYNRDFSPYGEILEISDDRKRLKIKWANRQRYVRFSNSLENDELQSFVEYKTNFVIKVVCNAEDAKFDELFLNSKGLIIGSEQGRTGQLIDVSPDRKEILVRWKDAVWNTFSEDKEPERMTFLVNIAEDYNYKIIGTYDQWLRKEKEIQAKMDEENYPYMDYYGDEDDY